MELDPLGQDVFDGSCLQLCSELLAIWDSCSCCEVEKVFTVSNRKIFFFGLQRRDCDGFGEIWNIARIVPLYGLVKNPCPIETKPSQLVQSRR